MNNIEKIRSMTVLIYKNESYQGSGVLVKCKQNHFVITADHVINNDSEVNDNSILLKTEMGLELSPLSILNRSNDEEIDLAVLQVDSSNIDINETFFCEDITFPDIELSFRGTAKSEQIETHTIQKCLVDTPPNSNGIFCLKIPGDQYSNAEGESGGVVLQGYSGSGVFYSGPDSELLLTGIVQTVSNNDFPGVNCISISKVKEYLIPEIIISDFHSGNAEIKIKISELKKEITQKLINKHKNDSYSAVKNLSKKMDVFLGSWDTEELDSFVEDMLLWDLLEHKKIRHSDYQDLIDDSKANLAAGNNKHIVSNIADGNTRFNEIKKEFKEILKEHLKGTPLEKHISVIAAGETARLLANCRLNFELIGRDNA